MAKVDCGDFLEFQEQLKRMRDVDDKIIYALNTSIPTSSFKGQVDASGKCKELFSELSSIHNQREEAIKKCILESAGQAKDLKAQWDANQGDVLVNKSYKSEQRKLRLLQAELNIEDIVKERTLKIFNERCRLFFKAS